MLINILIIFYQLLEVFKNLEEKKQKLQNIIEVINERLNKYEYDRDRDIWKDAEDLKKGESYLKLDNINISSYVFNISYKCAIFLIINDDTEKLVKLFNFDDSGLFKNQLGFKIAKTLIEEGDIRGIKVLTNIISLKQMTNNGDNLFHIAVSNAQIDILKYQLGIAIDKKRLIIKIKMEKLLLNVL